MRKKNKRLINYVVATRNPVDADLMDNGIPAMDMIYNDYDLGGGWKLVTTRYRRAVDVDGATGAYLVRGHKWYKIGIDMATKIKI